jgi:hypothetical protein
MSLAQNMYPQKTEVFMNAYNAATKEPHKYLFIDLKQNTPENERLSVEGFNHQNGKGENKQVPPPPGIPNNDMHRDLRKELVGNAMIKPSSDWDAGSHITNEDHDLNIPGDKKSEIFCYNCGIVFQNMYDLQNHIRKWCNENMDDDEYNTSCSGGKKRKLDIEFTTADNPAYQVMILILYCYYIVTVVYLLCKYLILFRLILVFAEYISVL